MKQSKRFARTIHLNQHSNRYVDVQYDLASMEQEYKAWWGGGVVPRFTKMPAEYAYWWIVEAGEVLRDHWSHPVAGTYMLPPALEECYLCGEFVNVNDDEMFFHPETGYIAHQSCYNERLLTW